MLPSGHTPSEHVAYAPIPLVPLGSRAKQRLKSFLLRNGIRYEGKSSWTPSHMNYLRHLTLPDPTQNMILEGYLQTIDACLERVASFEDKMKQVLTDWEWRPIVEALMACKGFKEVAAMTFVSEQHRRLGGVLDAA